MKVNMPVTNNEVMFDESEFMLTKTDLKGVIQYANADFIKTSGFSEAELVGQSHNVVRHPDMPSEAFEDMWRDLQSGKPWTGMVKNRTKTGDYYWVEANAAPIIENGIVTGYLSARRKPKREQVDAAAAAYRLFKEGKAQGLKIVHGQVVADNLSHKLHTFFQRFSLKQRFSLILAFSILAAIVLAGLGYSELNKSNQMLDAQLQTLSSKVVALDKAAAPAMADLVKQQSLDASKNLAELATLSTAGLTFVILVLFWLSASFIRNMTRPLQASLKVFERMSIGKLDSAIQVPSDDEVSKVLQGLKIMQTMLSVNENETKVLAKRVKDQSELYEGQLRAIGNSTGVVEFNMDHTLLTANQIFLDMMGYTLDEAVGKNHSMFAEEGYRNSAEYKEFWAKLERGEALAGEYRRIGKGGKEVWMMATYNPLLDLNGKPYKVVKYANEITAQKIKNADYEGQIHAISRSQGIVEIDVNANIINANKNYLDMLGYTEQELFGKPASMVLDPNFVKTEAYRALWAKVVGGDTDSGQYKRIHKSGREVWIQASYNPIFDLNGKVYKVVNYTMDITQQKLEAADNAGKLSAIDKIQGVVEFDMSAKLISANENFLSIVGYSKDEVIGKHHSMFVDPVYRASSEYKTFWEKLNRGEAQIGQYKRQSKDGKEIWLQGSYNPIMDVNGKPIKVVKYAIDITSQHKSEAALAEAVEETNNIIVNAKGGDLSSRVSLDDKAGSIASLCDGVNSLMDQMTEVILQVRDASETINTAAGEIASGNNDLSQRTEEQASSLEETAASMEELASTVKNNAENAKQANQLAIAASGIAVKGGKVVSEVVDTMSAINESAKKIEDIISVIDGIAFQTNILALNAAVEAARAGEQGRGFAVVAGEVRNLAQRSASAAKEIKELITDSVSKTAEGTKQVETAGSTMQEIVSSVQRVTDIMSEITAASVEQSAGIDQVNTAITSMDEVTQQNAALVEEAAAAAESLAEQSASLTETVSVFKLSAGSNYGVSKAKARAPSPSHAAVVKAAPKPVKAVAAKASGDDGDWEEF